MSRDRLIVLALLGGYLMLLLDVRFEHQKELAKEWEAWIPIVFSGMMVLVGGGCAAIWKPASRWVLLGGFAISLIIGMLGVWFHSDGHPIRGLLKVVSAWYSEPGRKGPPVLAPLAFAGLGLVGIINGWKR